MANLTIILFLFKSIQKEQSKHKSKPRKLFKIIQISISSIFFVAILALQITVYLGKRDYIDYDSDIEPIGL